MYTFSVRTIYQKDEEEGAGKVLPLEDKREPCRGTSLIRNRPLLGPYSRTVSRALW